MFGIAGLDPFGLVHAGIGCAALVCGLVVLRRAKGSASHRVWGAAYVAAMLLLNASALAIYDFNGRLNTFHVLALGSLATLAAGWIPALVRRPGSRWRHHHAMNMAWSYAGLVAAFAAEIVTRIPAFRHGPMFGAAVGGASLLVIGCGALLIHRHVPRLVRVSAATADDGGRGRSLVV